MVRHDDGVMEAQRLGFGIALDEVAKPLGAAEFAAAAASRGAGEQYEPYMQRFRPVPQLATSSSTCAISAMIAHPEFRRSCPSLRPRLAVALDGGGFGFLAPI